jgi:hypothetical protein
VTDDKETDLPEQQTPEAKPRCPACAAFPRLAQQFMNPRDGKTVRLYECQCGERIWDD